MRGLRVNFGQALLGLWIALGFGATACKPDCALLTQTVIIDAPDGELQPLIDACVAHRPAGDETCSATDLSRSSGSAVVECGCLPLCRAVLQIIDQFPGTEAIDQCRFQPAALASFDAGTSEQGRAKVTIGYRPSSCP